MLIIIAIPDLLLLTQYTMRDAFRKMLRFLVTAKGLTENEAISRVSVATDFGFTQVVEGNLGVHRVINKSVFTSDAH